MAAGLSAWYGNGLENGRSWETDDGLFLGPPFYRLPERSFGRDLLMKKYRHGLGIGMVISALAERREHERVGSLLCGSPPCGARLTCLGLQALNLKPTRTCWGTGLEVNRRTAERSD